MDFTFDCELTKADKDDEGRLFLSGIRSTTDKDLQNDIVSASRISDMAKNAVGIPVVTAHNHEFTDEIGTVVESSVQDGTKLFVKTELDKDDPIAQRTWAKIAKGAKAGFSIGGGIKAVSPGLGKAKRIIDGVVLQHVMVTSKPANPNTFAVALHKALDSNTLLIDECSKQEDGKNMATENETVEKAGAQFSAANIDKFKEILGLDNLDAMKAKISEVLGIDVSGDGKPSMVNDDEGTAKGAKDSDDKPVGVIESPEPQALADNSVLAPKGEIVKTEAPVIDANVIKKAIQEAMAEIAKTSEPIAEETPVINPLAKTTRSERAALFIMAMGPDKRGRNAAEILKTHYNKTEVQK